MAFLNLLYTEAVAEQQNTVASQQIRFYLYLHFNSLYLLLWIGKNLLYSLCIYALYTRALSVFPVAPTFKTPCRHHKHINARLCLAAQLKMKMYHWKTVVVRLFYWKDMRVRGMCRIYARSLFGKAYMHFIFVWRLSTCLWNVVFIMSAYNFVTAIIYVLCIYINLIWNL